MEDYQKRFVLNILAYAAQKDVSLEQLCRLAGIDLRELKENAHYQLTFRQLDSLWRNVMYLSKDEVFALHLGESMQLAALGVVGELIQNSQTIGEAIQHGAAFAQLVTNVFSLSVSHSNQTFVMEFVANSGIATEHPFVFRQMVETFMVFAIHELDGLVLKKVRPIRVHLAVPAGHRTEYQRVFRCENLIESDKYILEFESSYWHEPILTANYELQRLLLQKIQATSPTETKVKVQLF